MCRRLAIRSVPELMEVENSCVTLELLVASPTSLKECETGVCVFVCVEGTVVCWEWLVQT
jgi:hypothetical protein